MSGEGRTVDIEYRRLTPSDISLALGMNADFRAGLVDRNTVEKFLNNTRNWLFAAIYADKVVGFAYGYRMARMDGRSDMLYIHEVGVADAMQRRGVGTAMMRALFDQARREGVGKLFLLTAKSNAAANALYRKVGGEVSSDSGGDDVCYFFMPEEGAKWTSSPHSGCGCGDSSRPTSTRLPSCSPTRRSCVTSSRRSRANRPKTF